MMSTNATLYLVASLLTVSLTSCEATGFQRTNVTPQMTVQPETLKAGVPESVIKESIFTFYQDPNPKATAGDKTQYLSRTRGKDGPLYLAQCKEGKCFALQIYYQNNLVDVPIALKAMYAMLPADCPNQTKVSDKEMKAGNGFNEFHYFGEFVTGVVTYSDKTKVKVGSVSIFLSPGEKLEAAYAGKHGHSDQTMAEGR